MHNLLFCLHNVDVKRPQNSCARARRMKSIDICSTCNIWIYYLLFGAVLGRPFIHQMHQKCSAFILLRRLNAEPPHYILPSSHLIYLLLISWSVWLSPAQWMQWNGISFPKENIIKKKHVKFTVDSRQCAMQTSNIINCPRRYYSLLSCELQSLIVGLLFGCRASFRLEYK